MVAFTLLIFVNSNSLAVVLGFLIGLILIPIIPIGFEFACEITFPIGEAMSGGFLMLLA